MNKCARDARTIRQADPTSVLTCHDEYLGSMARLLDLPPLFHRRSIIDLYAAVCDGDRERAAYIQNRINPIKDVVYGSSPRAMLLRA